MGYVWGWILCLAATAVVIACGLWMTRRWKPLLLRDLVRAFAIATLLVPVTAGKFDGFYAPAYVVLMYEGLFVADGDPIPALSALTLAWGAALVTTIVLAARRRFWRRARD